MTAELQGGVWRISDKVGQLDGATAAARAKPRGPSVGKQDRVHLCASLFVIRSAEIQGCGVHEDSNTKDHQ